MTLANAEVARRWAEGKTCRGGNVCSIKPHSNNLIEFHSYQTPVAYHNGKLALVDCTNYSSSRARHQDKAAYAAHRKGMAVLRCPFSLVGSGDFNHIRVLETRSIWHYGDAIIRRNGSDYLLGHGDGAVFLCQLPEGEYTTIGAAYEALKPPEVVKAEEDGVDVLRQGEWFFIRIGKVRNGLPVYKRHRFAIGGMLIPSSGFGKYPTYWWTLPQGNPHRPTHAKLALVRQEGTSSYYEHVVRGTVRHAEHSMLKLGMPDWWLPVRNLAINARSWRRSTGMGAD